jgi:hypothetical protein
VGRETKREEMREGLVELTEMMEGLDHWSFAAQLSGKKWPIGALRKWLRFECEKLLWVYDKDISHRARFGALAEVLERLGERIDLGHCPECGDRFIRRVGEEYCHAFCYQRAVDAGEVCESAFYGICARDGCGMAFRKRASGKQRLYCSDACRIRVYRERKREAGK